MMKFKKGDLYKYKGKVVEVAQHYKEYRRVIVLDVLKREFKTAHYHELGGISTFKKLYWRIRDYAKNNF